MLIALPLLGYLMGSLPFSIWMTRRLKGVDLRAAGSGHATTTNTIRQAGFAAGAAVLVFDMTKGFFPTWLALHYAPLSSRIWVVALTAALAVAGHCWPVFAQFRGGMGLATGAGGLLAASPLGFLIAAAVLIVLTLVLHHGARAGLLAGILIAPSLWLAGLRGVEFWIAIASGIVIAVRFFHNWNRKYRELWLDREKS